MGLPHNGLSQATGLQNIISDIADDTVSHKRSILRKAHRISGDTLSQLVPIPFILPLLECCASVWSSAEACRLHLDRVVRTAGFLCDGSVVGDLCPRRDVNSVCMFYKIRCIPFHTLHHSLPRPYVLARSTLLASSLHLVYSQFVVSPSSSNAASFRALCNFVTDHL